MRKIVIHFSTRWNLCIERQNDFDSFMEDTMKAGHYENRKESVEIMINSSRDIINELIGHGVNFATKDGELDYTREGAHSKPRIYSMKILREKKSHPLIRCGSQIRECYNHGICHHDRHY